jgi:nitrite reductase (NO-forming)
MSRRFGLSQRVAVLRIVFGVIWLIDAGVKMNHVFVNQFKADFTEGAAGQPDWLHWWFRFWTHVINTSPATFAYITIVLEALIGLALVFGFARRATYLIGFLFSMAIWAIPEGFGGPYSMSSTDISTGIIYALVFAALYGLDTAVTARPAWTVDEKIERRFSWWRPIAEP